MAPSQDKEEDSILPKYRQTKSNKRANTAGEASSRNKKSIGKKRRQIQESDTTDSEDSDASATESSKALSLRRNEQAEKLTTKAVVQDKIGKQKNKKVASKKNRTAKKKTKHIPKYFEHSIGDGKGKFIFDSNSGQALLNWGVATYKRIMHPD